jgi:prepilin-type N-terminal cleavage/methylation domain-containing protein
MSRSFFHPPSASPGFTLIELLVVIAIVAFLSIVVVLVLNPAQLLQQSRDSNRIFDMATMNSATGVYLAQGGVSLGTPNVVYVSIPDPVATSSAGDQCQGLSLLSLPAGYTYQCAASSTFRRNNGTGWAPINFASLAIPPLGSLPIDPINTSSSRDYYTYTTNGSQYEVTAAMESQKYQIAGSNDVIGPDGGILVSVYEKGTKLGLEPLDYGDSSLVGYWALNEGTGTVAYDGSGNNATGSWGGTQIGTNGYYTTNAKVGPYAGDFDGSTDYVLTSSAIPNMTALTKTFWYYFAGGIFSSYSTIVDIGPTPAGIYAQGWAGSNGFAFGAAVTSGGNSWSGVSNEFDYILPSTGWYFVAQVVTPSLMSIYVNGSLVGSLSGLYDLTKTQQRLAVCGFLRSNSHGVVDDVRVYNRALSAAQISAVYASGK